MRIIGGFVLSDDSVKQSCWPVICGSPTYRTSYEGRWDHRVY